MKTWILSICLLTAMAYEGEAMDKKEIPIIVKVAIEHKLGLEDTYMLLAMRDAENGGKGNELGVVMAKGTNLETQAKYAARSIKLNRARYADYMRGEYQGSRRRVTFKDYPNLDFVTFMAYYGGPTGYGWAPLSVKGNENWDKNVRNRVEYYKKEMEKYGN